MNDRLPSMALSSLRRIREQIGRRKPAFFLDLDGTLAPLVLRPELAEIPERTMEVLDALARDYLECFISGRDLADLRQKVGIAHAFYAADHGYRVLGPGGSDIELDIGPPQSPELELAARELERRLHSIEGALVEVKGRSLSVHYRMVAEEQRALVAEVVQKIADSAPSLRLTHGKMVHELRPAIAWGKGRAMLWLLGQLGLGPENTCPVCIGDDLTDEDMFIAARGWGVTVIVGRPDRATDAGYRLPDCDSTAEFLSTFISPRG